MKPSVKFRTRSMRILRPWWWLRRWAKGPAPDFHRAVTKATEGEAARACNGRDVHRPTLHIAPSGACGLQPLPFAGPLPAGLAPTIAHLEAS